MKIKKLIMIGAIFILMFSFISTINAIPVKTYNKTARNSPVFVEFFTDITNTKGIETAKILQSLFESGELNFNYVTILDGIPNTANEDLIEDYKIVGYPTAIFQGGYDTLYNVNPVESTYENKINQISNRYIPDLEIELEKKWIADCCNAKARFTIVVTNNEAYTYRGFLKVYVSEIESKINYTYEGVEEPFNYGLIDIAIDQQITIQPNSNVTIVEEWVATPFALIPANVKATAVVASATAYTGYSDPPANENSFRAYYIDQINSKKIIENPVTNNIEFDMPFLQRILQFFPRLNNLFQNLFF